MSAVPLRVLFDTNVYGLIVQNADSRQFVYLLKNRPVLVCGSTVVRKELRDISKKAVVGRSKLRSVALGVYDALVVDKRNYSVTEIVKTTALEYNEHYKGSFSWKELEDDFLIVAIASIHNIDIVVSNDERTMTSKDALNAYREVNENFELRTPRFRKFEDFQEMV